MILIRELRLNQLRSRYPQIEKGTQDAASRMWTDIQGHCESFAYELGRMLHLYRPSVGALAPGLLLVTRDVELTIRELEQATYDAEHTDGYAVDTEHEEGTV